MKVPIRWTKSLTGQTAFIRYLETNKIKLLDSYEECTEKRNFCPPDNCTACEYDTDINKIWRKLYNEELERIRKKRGKGRNAAG